MNFKAKNQENHHVKGSQLNSIGKWKTVSEPIRFMDFK